MQKRSKLGNTTLYMLHIYIYIRHHRTPQSTQWTALYITEQSHGAEYTMDEHENQSCIL